MKRFPVLLILGQMVISHIFGRSSAILCVRWHLFSQIFGRTQPALPKIHGDIIYGCERSFFLGGLVIKLKWSQNIEMVLI